MDAESGDTAESETPGLTWRTPLRELRSAFFLGASLVGLTSGVAGLLTSGSPGAVVLRVVAGLCVAFVIARLLNALLIVDRRRLRGQIEQSQLRFAEYKNLVESERHRILSAVERLTDRQGLLFSDELTIDVTIGKQSSDDKVVQHHTTTPSPYLLYRSLRPVVPVDLPVPITFDDLDLRVSLEEGDGIRTILLPLVTNNRGVRILVIFEPPVDRTIKWVLEYRPHGLWDTLRRDGVDQMAWDARTTSGHTTLTEFVVNFHFPNGASCAVAERGRHRAVTRPGNGHNTFQWRDPSPAGTRYVWDLTMEMSD